MLGGIGGGLCCAPATVDVSSVKSATILNATSRMPRFMRYHLSLRRKSLLCVLTIRTPTMPRRHSHLRADRWRRTVRAE